MLLMLVVLGASTVSSIKSSSVLSNAPSTDVQCPLASELYETFGAQLDWSPSPPEHNCSQTACSWEGISCDSSGFITSIIIRQPVVGHFPSRITLAPQLQTISFAAFSNLQNSSIPESICQNSMLGVLQAPSCELSGSLFPCLFQYNMLSVILPGNHLEGVIPPLSSRLFLVSLSQNRLSGPFPFSYLNATSLLFFDISHNQLGGPLPESFDLYSNDQEQQLFLNNNRFTGAYPEMLPFSGLGQRAENPSYLSSSSLTIDLRNNLFDCPPPPGCGLYCLPCVDQLSSTAPLVGGLTALVVTLSLALLSVLVLAGWTRRREVRRERSCGSHSSSAETAHTTTTTTTATATTTETTPLLQVREDCGLIPLMDECSPDG